MTLPRPCLHDFQELPAQIECLQEVHPKVPSAERLHTPGRQAPSPPRLLLLRGLHQMGGLDKIKAGLPSFHAAPSTRLVQCSKMVKFLNRHASRL